MIAETQAVRLTSALQKIGETARGWLGSLAPSRVEWRARVDGIVSLDVSLGLPSSIRRERFVRDYSELLESLDPKQMELLNSIAPPDSLNFPQQALDIMQRVSRNRIWLRYRESRFQKEQRNWD